MLRASLAHRITDVPQHLHRVQQEIETLEARGFHLEAKAHACSLTPGAFPSYHLLPWPPMHSFSNDRLHRYLDAIVVSLEHKPF